MVLAHLDSPINGRFNIFLVCVKSYIISQFFVAPSGWGTLPIYLYLSPLTSSRIGWLGHCTGTIYIIVYLQVKPRFPKFPVEFPFKPPIDLPLVWWRSDRHKVMDIRKVIEECRSEIQAASEDGKRCWGGLSLEDSARGDRQLAELASSNNYCNGWL